METFYFYFYFSENDRWGLQECAAFSEKKKECAAIVDELSYSNDVSTFILHVLFLLAGTTRSAWWPCSPGLGKNFPFLNALAYGQVRWRQFFQAKRSGNSFLLYLFIYLWELAEILGLWSWRHAFVSTDVSYLIKLLYQLLFRQTIIFGPFFLNSVVSI